MYLLTSITDQEQEQDPSACLRSCFNDKPACPDNMDAKKLDDCWTCCLRIESNYGITQPGAGIEKCHLKLGDYCCKGVCASTYFAGWEGTCERGL
ncbi:hypothetical protein BJX61DRAFT_544818 [Aspergillus egyptiacus]|nr:hypothetical protein BJX61DRAFT_544818 [Aspergillus egyptiacus]